MPNHCSNTLTVSGTDEAMRAFYAILDKPLADTGDGEFKMQKFLPTPDDLLKVNSPNTFRPLNDGEKVPMIVDGEMVMEVVDANGVTEAQFNSRLNELRLAYGFTNWYDWRIANWGTKWDCYDLVEQYRNDDEYCVSYDTAWSPNIDFLRHIVNDFPELKFQLEYCEEGGGFAGEFTISEEDGEYGEEKEISYLYLLTLESEEGFPTKFKFLPENFDEEEYPDYESYTLLNKNYVSVLNDYNISSEQIVNYDELVASYQ